MIRQLVTGATASLVVIVAASTRLPAAEISDVKDAFDGNRKWTAGLEVSYWRSSKRAKITREFGCDPATGGTDATTCPTRAATLDGQDVAYSQVDQSMLVRGRFGLYHDFELYFILPFIFSSDRQATVAAGVIAECSSDGVASAATTSGIVRDGVFTGGRARPSSDLDPFSVYGLDSFGGAYGGRPCPGGNTGLPAKSSRSGLGDLILGLAWAPTNQDRDPVKATWVLGLEFTFPTGEAMDPGYTSVAAANFAPKNAAIGKGLWAFKWYTTFARRLTAGVEPYAGLDFEMAFAARNKLFRQVATTQDHIAPGPVAGIIAGIEFFPWVNRSEERKFSVDLRLRMSYTGEGRGYSEVSDFIGRVSTIEQYMTIGGQLSIYIQPVRNLQIRAMAGLDYAFDHYLTFADRGKDINGSGRIDPESGEKSPTFDENTDKPGSRLRVSDMTVFSLMFTLIGQF